MSVADLGNLLRRLRRMCEHPGQAAPTDADVLARFVANRDEAAFELLVWRHGPAVLGLCRRLLGREQDAEDAFQAAFLALARRARSIRQGASLASWLYKVAYRVAGRLRSRSARHPQLSLEGQPEPADPPQAGPDREVRAVLDEEVGRLPDKYRAAVVLCYLEGKTNAEAARELGCARGTIDSRLAWARQRLRRRLERRGVALATTALLTLATAPASALVPALLAHTTAHHALAFACGNALAAARSVYLAQGVLRAMLLAKMKIFTIVLLSLALVGGGSWSVFHAPAAVAQTDRAKAPDTGPVVPVAANPDDPWVLVATLRAGGPVRSVAFSPDAKTLATGGGKADTGGELYLWDVASARLRVKVETDHPVRRVVFTPDGGTMATAEQDRSVYLRDAQTGGITVKLSFDLGTRAVAFSPDGKLIALGSTDNGVRILSLAAVQAGPVVRMLGEGGVYGLAFSPDGKVLLAGEDSGARVWDVKTGKEIRQIRGAKGDKEAVRSVAFSPDGRRIATAGADRTVRLWDAATGKEIVRVQGQGREVGSVAFSPDGKVLAATGDAGKDDRAGDGEVLLLDLATGMVVAKLRGHTGAVLAVAMSPDGKFLASGGDDGTVRLWQRRTDRVIVRPGARTDVQVSDRLDQLLDHLLREGRSDAQVAEALCLATLGRLPTEAEKDRFVKVADTSPKGRRQAFEDLLFALTSSTEFQAHVQGLQNRAARSGIDSNRDK
jgi:RNA polymerase sigma factor (sigma-70 family)